MRALFLGAHPDDVETGAGGTIQTLVEDGWEVWVSTTHHIRERIGEGVDASKILGATYMPYSRIGPSGVSEFVAYFSGLPLDLIVTSSPTDSHQDHRAVAELGLSLARKNNIALWQMNHAIPGGIYNAPQLNHFVMHSLDQHNVKEQALRAHKSQSEKYGPWWEDTVYMRDRYYGSMIDRENVVFAEGFHIVIG